MYEHNNLNRRLFLGTSLTAAAAVLPTFSTSPAYGKLQTENQNRIPVGMNLSGISDYDVGFPFINQMWGSRLWLTRFAEEQGPWDTNQHKVMEVDENGYPIEVPFKGSDGKMHTCFTILPNRGKAGKYILRYDGEGEFAGEGGTKIIDKKPGEITLTMLHKHTENFDGIKIVKSKKGNNIHNIRVVAEEFANHDLAKSAFIPEFVEYCRQFHALRFMDWLGTNNSINSKWADRKKLTFFTQQGESGDAMGLYGQPMEQWKKKYASGVAIELCIDIANQAGCHAWLCVPHLADDDYIEQMAKLTLNRLDPKLKVYIEYSNEVWNWQFQQSQWNLNSKQTGDLANQLGVDGWNKKKEQKFNEFGYCKNGSGENFPERIASNSLRVFKIWSRVFDGENRKRLVRVASGQAAWFDVTKRSLETVMKNGGCDAVTVAGYFGPNEKVYQKWETAGKNLTSDDVIADMKNDIAIEVAKQGTFIRELCQKHKVDFLAYEGGQHIQPEGQQEKAYMPALKASQYSQGMYECYMQLLKQMKEADCKLFMAFASIGMQGNKYGSWGHVESYTQPLKEAPKMRALVDSNTTKAK